MRHEEALELFGKRFEEEGATPAANNQLWDPRFLRPRVLSTGPNPPHGNLR